MEKLLRILHLKKNNILDKENHTLERDRRIFLTIISGIVAQGLSNAIPLITTKFSLNYLGVEIYGLWMAITSFFSFTKNCANFKHKLLFPDSGEPQTLIIIRFFLLFGAFLGKFR